MTSLWNDVDLLDLIRKLQEFVNNIFFQLIFLILDYIIFYKKIIFIQFITTFLVLQTREYFFLARKQETILDYPIHFTTMYLIRFNSILSIQFNTIIQMESKKLYKMLDYTILNLVQCGSTFQAIQTNANIPFLLFLSIIHVPIQRQHLGIKPFKEILGGLYMSH